MAFHRNELYGKFSAEIMPLMKGENKRFLFKHSFYPS